MYVYICVYVCMYACVCVCVCARARACARACVRAYERMSEGMRVRLCRMCTARKMETLIKCVGDTQGHVPTEHELNVFRVVLQVS